MLAICAGIAVLFVVVRGDASVRGRERDFVSGDLPTVRMEMRDDFFKESSSPIHLDAASATESQGSTRLVLGAIASDGTPEPGVIAAAVTETVAIPEPTVVAEPAPIAVDVDAIDRFLSGSPLAGMGNVFVAAAAMYGIDPRLMPAVSLHESGRCLHHEAASHNCWGLTTGQRTVEGHLIFRDFDSYEDAIWAVSRTYGGYGLPTYAALCMWVSGRASCDSDYPGKVIATMEGIR